MENSFEGHSEDYYVLMVRILSLYALITIMRFIKRKKCQNPLPDNEMERHDASKSREVPLCKIKYISIQVLY